MLDDRVRGGVPVTELTVVGKRKGYTSRQKVTAVIAAEMTTQAGGCRTGGHPTQDARLLVPMTRSSPSIARKCARRLGPEGIALAHNVLSEIRRRLPEFEPRDLSTLYGILIDKAQLVTGQATSRSETRAITDGMNDHETAALRKIIDEVVAASEVVA